MAVEVWLLVLMLAVFLTLVLWIKLPVGLALAITGLSLIHI